MACLPRLPYEGIPSLVEPVSCKTATGDLFTQALEMVQAHGDNSLHGHDTRHECNGRSPYE
jgi:hypothetical protein